MIADLEVWLVGTPDQLDRAIAALTAAGRAAQTGDRHRLAGANAGRARQYLRLAVTATPPTIPGQRPPLRTCRRC